MACDKHQHCWHLFCYRYEPNGDKFIVQMCCCCETERLDRMSEQKLCEHGYPAELCAPDRPSPSASAPDRWTTQEITDWDRNYGQQMVEDIEDPEDTYEAALWVRKIRYETARALTARTAQDRPGPSEEEWLTGEIGASKARSREAEITAIVDSLGYAKLQISFSNYDCGNIDKAINLLRLLAATPSPVEGRDWPSEEQIKVAAASMKQLFDLDRFEDGDYEALARYAFRAVTPPAAGPAPQGASEARRALELALQWIDPDSSPLDMSNGELCAIIRAALASAPGEAK